MSDQGKPRGLRGRVPLRLVLLASVIVTNIAIAQSGWGVPDRIVSIQSSSAFDLADRDTALSYAHFVTIARIEEVVAQNGELTIFRATPMQGIKGVLPQSIKVAQIGFRQGDSTFQLEEQPLFDVGGTYLLALAVPSEEGIASGVLSVLAGTVSGQPLSPNDLTQLEALRGAAVAHKWPKELTAAAEQDHNIRGEHWVALHPGFGLASE